MSEALTLWWSKLEYLQQERALVVEPRTKI